MQVEALPVGSATLAGTSTDAEKIALLRLVAEAVRFAEDFVQLCVTDTATLARVELVNERDSCAVHGSETVAEPLLGRWGVTITC